MSNKPALTNKQRAAKAKAKRAKTQAAGPEKRVVRILSNWIREREVRTDEAKKRALNKYRRRVGQKEVV